MNKKNAENYLDSTAYDALMKVEEDHRIESLAKEQPFSIEDAILKKGLDYAKSGFEVSFTFISFDTVVIKMNRKTFSTKKYYWHIEPLNFEHSYEDLTSILANMKRIIESLEANSE